MKLLPLLIAFIILQILAIILIPTALHGQTVVRSVSNGALFIAETIKLDSGYSLILHDGGLESERRFTVHVSQPDSMAAVIMLLFDGPRGAVFYFEGIRLQRLDTPFNLVEISTPDGQFTANKKVMRKVFGL